MSVTRFTDATYAQELMDLAVAELFTMQKEEFAELVAGCEVSVEQLAIAAREINVQAAIVAGKERLRLAHESLRTRRESGRIPVSLQDPRRARDYVRRLASSSALMREKFTLAARNGTALSDEDVQSIIEDLASLGELPDIDSL